MGLGSAKDRINTAKRRAESVPIEMGLRLIEVLNLTQKDYAEVFCCVNEDTFGRWKRRGWMPANRFWASQKALTDYFFKEYQEKMRIISDN